MTSEHFREVMDSAENSIRLVEVELEKYASARASVEQASIQLDNIRLLLSQLITGNQELVESTTIAVDQAVDQSIANLERTGQTAEQTLNEIRALTAQNIEEMKVRSGAVLESLEKLQISSLLNEMGEIEKRMTTLLHEAAKNTAGAIKKSTSDQLADMIVELQRANQDSVTGLLGAINTQNASTSSSIIELQGRVDRAFESTVQSNLLRSWLQVGILGILIVVGILTNFIA